MKRHTKTLEGTATFHLENNSSYAVIVVNFGAVVGGQSDNNTVWISPGNGEYFYSIQPGTYDIWLLVDNGGNAFLAFDNFVFGESVVYFRAIDDSDIP